MKLAGQEECELAIARGTTCLDDPAIIVILDGCWSKRTYKHLYNAKSGVANIIDMKQAKSCLWEFRISIVVYVLEPLMVNQLNIPATKTEMAPHQQWRQTS